MSDHELWLHNEIEEVPDPEGARRWVERRLTGKSRANCTCGIDTGLIESDAAREAFKEHYPAAAGKPWGVA